MTKITDIPAIRFKGFSDTWEQRKLGDIYGSIGNAFVGTATPYYAEHGHFYLESNNVKDGQINHNAEIFINDEFYEKQKDKWLHTGDMVMVQSGHVGHAAVIPEELDNTAAHALIMFRNPKEEIEPYFLNYEYQTDKAKKQIENITTGNTIKHILASDMQEFVVDIPKYEEQKAIAGYFCKLDHLITLHQCKCQIDGCRFQSPLAITWEQRKVTEIGKIYIGLVTTMTKHYTDEGTLLIRNSDIKDGKFEFGDNPIYLEKTFAEKNETRMHQIGDVITVHTGDVGTSAVITENEAKSIGFATIVTRPNPKIIDSNYLCSFLNTDKHKKWAVSISTGDGRTNYNLGDYFELVVPVPSIAEQKKIASYIQKLNRLITLHQRKYDKLTNVKKSMLEKMFPQNGSNAPEIRFKGFTEAWEQRKLGEIGSVSMCRRIFKEQTSENGEIPFYKIGTFGGEADAFISRELFEEYKAKYQYPKKGDILISASGSIGRTVVFTGKNEYFQDSNIVWLNHDKHLDNSFLKCFYSIVKWAGIEGSTIKRLYNDNILNTAITLPSVEEQQKIGAYFENLDNLITLHQRELEKLKNLKKACLEKMFV